MAMATKLVSSFAAIFILFLVIFEVSEIGAQDSECLKEYGGDVGAAFCGHMIYPTICYTKCRENKGAKGGRCIWKGAGNFKCFCDFCSNEPGQIISGI
ncbi:unnamed protein product [Eruca vesicaria subsp. sativa]|uniref:Knottins-like domain-containing protein n=1 Tax=Eruca vesicaria subsp. sativa TaxID=29727 RepID=A0ABC8L3T0_ERUVS|nr:unnamed protein product [Eruca vesicaria subsp. sativa]